MGRLVNRGGKTVMVEGEDIIDIVSSGYKVCTTELLELHRLVR